MPNIGSDVLVFNNEGFWVVHISESMGHIRFWPQENGCGCCSRDLKDVTHWMPLPKEPRDDDGMDKSKR